jgi:hypothetical protein
MPICKIVGYVYYSIFENALTNFITMPISKDNKLNSSKSIVQSSKHPFMKKNYMQNI